MIGVTEKAKQELKSILLQNVDNPRACLRLRVKENGELGLGIDIPMENDAVVEYEGAVLLVADRGLADTLENIAIDIDESGETARLVVVEKFMD